MCSFCNMRKIINAKITTLEEFNLNKNNLEADCNSVKRIYIVNDNTEQVQTEEINNLLIKLKKYFSKCKEIILCTEIIYIFQKTADELKKFKSLGIKVISLAIESGSSRILTQLKKCINQDQIIETGRKIKECGIKLSICLLSGIGGKDRWIEHAIESANVVNELDPYSVRIVNFNYVRHSELNKIIGNGIFIKLPPKLTLLEAEKFLEHLNVTNCIFICDKLSMNSELKGILPHDRQKIINIIEKYHENVNLAK